MTDLGSYLKEWSVIGAVGLFGAIVTVILRDLAHVRRERTLSIAVRQRTEELEYGRLREASRNRILEMLVSNQSLSIVLEGVAALVRREIPGVYCAILLKLADGWRLGAAPEFPVEWLAGLGLPYAVPFEVWKSPCRFPSPELAPAWRSFFGHLTSRGPAAIQSHPVGGSDLCLGAILLFEPEATEAGPGVLESAARLAQLAMEHSQFCDDLHFQANHDALTGLPNRALFEEHLHRALRDSRIHGRRLAVLFVDLDRFKQINDTLSHRVGDILLAEVATRMRGVVRPTDTVARIGGDEFNLLITNLASAIEAEEVAAHVLAVIRQPMIIDGHRINMSASLGIAVFPDDGTQPEDLQREADTAMYCAKGMGRDRIQSFSTRAEALDRVRMEQELRSALRQHRFAVHYQPMITTSGDFVGLEALLRLHLPDNKHISPGEFIPIAERSGLIMELGAWVLNEVCRQIAEWRDKGFGPVTVAVNISSLQISRMDFAQSVQECLARHDVSPSALELELTEGPLMASGDESQRQMRELRSAGIRFSIDDFGIGYSSLTYLQRLPIDTIKLDLTLVQSIDKDQGARRLIQSLTSAARELGLRVIAEGVETEAQRGALIAAGCRVMQGYLFARPQPASDLKPLLRSRTSHLDDLLRLEGAVEPVDETYRMLHPV